MDRPEPSYGKRLHRAARDDFTNFWSAHRYWVTFATGFFSPLVIQVSRHGVHSVVNLDETVTNAVAGLIISLIGTYLIAIRRGAETLDTGLRKEIREKDSTLQEQREHNRFLQDRLDAPKVSPLEQGRRDVVGSKLKRASPQLLEVLKYILQHGEVDHVIFITRQSPADQRAYSEAFQQGVILELLKHAVQVGSSRAPMMVNQDLKDALSFHLLESDDAIR